MTDNAPDSYQYNCPGCGKQVKTFRLGMTLTYLVKERKDDRYEDHECKYKGPITVKLSWG